MSKKTDLPVVSRHIQLYEEDWIWLEANYGQRSEKQFGTGKAIRKIIQTRVRELKAKALEKIDQGKSELKAGVES